MLFNPIDISHKEMLTVR